MSLRFTVKGRQERFVIDFNLDHFFSCKSSNRAKNEAEGIYNEYETEANTYTKIMTEQDLTTEGFLAYMGVRTIGLAHNPVYAGINAPAKTAWP